MKHYQHLTLFEREQIATYRCLGESIRDIARLLNRSHTTISREIARNDRAVPMMKGYVGIKAHELAGKRKSESGMRPRLKCQAIRDYAHEKLALGWTPEQIAHRLSQDKPGLSISHEAIYQYIYADYREGITYLPRRRPKRYPKRYGRNRQKGIQKIPKRISVLERPKSINQRQIFGHWESDSIESRQSMAILNVLLERQSRLVKLKKVKRKTAIANHQAIVSVLKDLPLKARLSITYDNGIENYLHLTTNKILNTASYFCEPYHSWEKGAVENINSFIRRFIPKKTDLAKLSDEEIIKIENLLNNRPRKCLGFKTPLEVFSQKCLEVGIDHFP